MRPYINYPEGIYWNCIHTYVYLHSGYVAASIRGSWTRPRDDDEAATTTMTVNNNNFRVIYAVLIQCGVETNKRTRIKKKKPWNTIVMIFKKSRKNNVKKKIYENCLEISKNVWNAKNFGTNQNYILQILFFLYYANNISTKKGFVFCVYRTVFTYCPFVITSRQ